MQEINYPHVIRLINKHVSKKLQNEGSREFIDYKVFKLLDYDNGMDVKKKIDKVLLEKKGKTFKMSSAVDLRGKGQN